jgi:methionyl-tRNA synthetase
MEQQIPFAIASLIWISIFLLIIWSLVWKGLALWQAARRGQKWWFFFLLIVNTAGLLEIFYLAFIAKIWNKKLATGTVPPPTTPTAPAQPMAGPLPNQPAATHTIPVPPISESK